MEKEIEERNDDMRIEGEELLRNFKKLVIWIDKRIGIGMKRIRDGGNKIKLKRKRILERGLIEELMRNKIGIGLKIGRIIELIGNEEEKVELENKESKIVEEVKVMGDDEKRKGILKKVILEKGCGLRIKMVGRIIEKKKVRIGKKKIEKRKEEILKERKIGEIRIERREE